MNKAKIETFFGFGETMIYSEKHPHEGKAQGQVCVEAHHEKVQDCELVEHRSHRDEEAPKLHLPACTGPVQKKHNTNLEEHSTADLSTRMFGGIENTVARKKSELRILDGTNVDD